MSKKCKIIMTVIFVIVIGCILGIVLSGCNRRVFDTTYKFDKAIISFPNGDILEGVVQSWADYSDTDRLQIKIDGKTYLVHSANCVLIAE